VSSYTPNAVSGQCEASPPVPNGNLFSKCHTMSRHVVVVWKVAPVLALTMCLFRVLVGWFCHRNSARHPFCAVFAHQISNYPFNMLVAPCVGGNVQRVAVPRNTDPPSSPSSAESQPKPTWGWKA
jgi:hypothetical protein